MTLGVILLTAALLYSWNLGYVGLSSYYAAGARSMASSTRALLFGALDPTGSLTLDKLSGFLVPQALAVSLLGFHAWALALPQVIEGVVTVAAAFVIGRRWRGDAGGLALAGLFTLTPVAAAMFGRPMEDGMLTMCEVLAFAAVQRALLSGHQRWLLASVLWLAIGFQAKMLQSWLLLPALLVAVLIGGPTSRRARWGYLVLAFAVCGVVSITWMTAIQLVPSGSRPYIDGTTNNDVFSMVFGYNGFDRLLPGAVPGAVPQLPATHSLTGGTRVSLASSSVMKLLLPQFTTQIGWLFPFAAVGLVSAAIGTLRWARARRDTTPERRHEIATLASFAVWLALPVVVLSLASVPHATYFGVIALPVAAFAFEGATVALRHHRTGHGRIWVPLLVLTQGVWAASIAAAVPQTRLFAALLVLISVIGGVCLAIGHTLRARRVLQLGIVASLGAALLGPALWSVFVLGSGGGGSATDGYAGPRIGASNTLALIAVGGTPALIHIHLPFRAPPDRTLDPATQQVLNYAAARNRAGAIPFASDDVSIVIGAITGSGASPLLIGGYSGHASHPTPSALAAMTTSHQLRFILLAGSSPTHASTATVRDADRRWVRAHCTSVLAIRFQHSSVAHQTLYDCGITPHAYHSAPPP